MASSLMSKLIRGGDRRERTTRFHDENDHFVGWWELRHAPHALATWFALRAFDALPAQPWWPYPAIERIKGILGPGSVVLEYGTGSSTIWMAERASRVHGVEGSPDWCERVRRISAERGLGNVVLHLRDSTRHPERGRYSARFNEEFAAIDEIAEPAFDLVVVDGAARWRCIEVSLPRVKPGGWLYLDNSDADKDWCHYTETGRSKVAQALLEAAVARGEGTLERFRGLCPATPLASEGMLFQKRRE